MTIVSIMPTAIITSAHSGVFGIGAGDGDGFSARVIKLNTALQSLVCGVSALTLQK